jgi:hypothetical protein
MPIVITLVARVRDWGPVFGERHGRLERCARRSGATRCLLYRDLHDASAALLLIELPDHDALRLLSVELAEEEGSFGEWLMRIRVWEPAASRSSTAVDRKEV